VAPFAAIGGNKRHAAVRGRRAAHTRQSSLLEAEFGLGRVAAAARATTALAAAARATTALAAAARATTALATTARATAALATTALATAALATAAILGAATTRLPAASAARAAACAAAARATVVASLDAATASRAAALTSRAAIAASLAAMPASLNAGVGPAPPHDPRTPPPTLLATRVRPSHHGRSPLRPAIARNGRYRRRGEERPRNRVGQLWRRRRQPRPGHDDGHHSDRGDHARDVAPAHASEQVGPHGFP
jgi:hypothetical protein